MVLVLFLVDLFAGWLDVLLVVEEDPMLCRSEASGKCWRNKSIGSWKSNASPDEVWVSVLAGRFPDENVVVVV